MKNEDYVDSRLRGKGVKFERIRRITGYLVGDLNRWNTGKKSEEADRVKHIADKFEEAVDNG